MKLPGRRGGELHRCDISSAASGRKFVPGDETGRPVELCFYASFWYPIIGTFDAEAGESIEFKACFPAAAAALRKARLFGSAVRLLLALLSLSTAGFMAMIVVATEGYRALTHEEVAAVVTIEPTGTKRFTAHFRFPDGREATYALAGDALYVDAHILKWKPLFNLLGLHTAYELDRVAGRYAQIKDERESSRTVFSLSREKPLDLFTLRQHYSLLGPLLDAEYGSASFIEADRAAKLAIKVSTTGLLIRKAADR